MWKMAGFQGIHLWGSIHSILSSRKKVMWRSLMDFSRRTFTLKSSQMHTHHFSPLIPPLFLSIIFFNVSPCLFFFGLAAGSHFPDQSSNLCPLHWQAAQPLRHQGSPRLVFLNVWCQSFILCLGYLGSFVC